MVRYRLSLLWIVLLGGVSACEKDASTAAPGGFRVGALLGSDGGGPDFVEARKPIRFEFPRDHGAHRDYRSEWWYLTAVLQNPAGAEYGVQFTIFRQGIAAPGVSTDGWTGQSLFMAHAAVTDVAADNHVALQRFGRDRPEIAGVTAQPFRAWVDGASMRAVDDGLLPMVVSVVDERLAIELTVEAGGRLVLQGEAGLSRKGEGNASYYYSLTRLPVQGYLTVEGENVAVAGLGWLDREWSTSVLEPIHAGWDWFALQLDDGSDIMVYQLRRHDRLRDPFDAGKVVYADGREETLAPADFELIPVDHWTDGAGVAWPRRWHLVRAGQRLIVTAAVDDQLMETVVRYWEGLVYVTDADGRHLGRGYMELTGYR